MQIPPIIIETAVDIAKKYAFKIGKRVAHKLVDSVTGKELGEIVVYKKQEGYNNVVLFVHGFSGKASETFGATPDMLSLNPEFAGWDIYSVGYSTDIMPTIGKGIWAANPDITKISQYLKTLLDNQFDDYERVAFVAHSMGGLAVQRLLLDLSDEKLKSISHVFMFGTPSDGLLKAFWVRFWSRQLNDLSKESDFIKKLRVDWKSKYPEKLPFFFRTIAGSKDEFVPVESSLKPFDNEFHGIIEGNHLTMVKPKDETDNEHQSYRIILSSLIGHSTAYLKGNPEDINLALGDYTAIINKFYGKSNELSLEKLGYLVFALECSGREEDALRVLNEHPSASSDSDTLGIIGGRHKRNYLSSGEQNDWNLAKEYYEKALDISLKNSNNQQVFYHAINLAFLMLIGTNDRGDVKRFAELALEHCISDVKNMWEYATMAEANMYLGHFDKAEEYYRKATEIAGNDVRAKTSMYSNAYYGYQSLMASNNTEAAFLKMLEEVLL